MRPSTPFFPGVHRILFGRAPSRLRSALSQSKSKVDALCLRQLGVLLGDWLPNLIASFKPKEGDNSRERTYTMAVTFWAFLSQVLDPGGSCLRAVCRLKSLMCSHQQELPEEDTAAYCRARARLPIKLLIRVSQELVRRLCSAATPEEPRRIVVMDGTGITLPDTAANREAYAYGPSQKPGCGFPLMKLVGLFDLNTGAWLATVKRGRRIHDSIMAWRLLKHLRPGDILVADRGFCSYAFIAVLKQRGIDVVMRVHHARQCDLRKGRHLGRGDSVQCWSIPLRAPLRSAAAIHQRDLPPQLEVRITRFDVSIKAHRTRQIWLVSTLLDPEQWSASAIAHLYLRRWQVELFFADIKTTMGMDMLRTRSPHMVARELLMHMIAYNVVRLLMVQAQPLRELGSSGVLSFKGTRDRLDQWQWCLWSASSVRQSQLRLTEMMQSIADNPFLERPNRREPRCRKRRPKNYQLMSNPRHQMRETPYRAQRRSRKKDAA